LADPEPQPAPFAPVPAVGRHRLAAEQADLVASAPVAETPPCARSYAPGRTALAAAVLMIAAVAVALAIDAPGRYLAATVLAIAADALSVIALVTGIVAIVRNRGRGAGIAALVIAVLGNPLVLLYGLGALA
jgi:hypothetical protein